MFTTTDTALASYLITQGFIPDKIDYTQPRYEYSFNSDSDIRIHASDYITGQARVDPATYNRINRKLNRIVKKGIQWEDD